MRIGGRFTARISILGCLGVVVACTAESARAPDAGATGSGGAAGAGGVGGTAANDAPSSGGGLTFDSSADAPPPTCECQPGDYWVNVLGDGEPQKLDAPCPFPNDVSCTPLVPWFGTTVGKPNLEPKFRRIGACSASGKACLLAMAGDPDSVYVDRYGTQWQLSNIVVELTSPVPPTSAKGQAIDGSFTATASNAGSTLPLSGEFHVCFSFVSILPV